MKRVLLTVWLVEFLWLLLRSSAVDKLAEVIASLRDLQHECCGLEIAYTLGDIITVLEGVRGDCLAHELDLSLLFLSSIDRSGHP